MIITNLHAKYEDLVSKDFKVISRTSFSVKVILNLTFDLMSFKSIGPLNGLYKI
jgi:hypothetical protein